MADILLGLLAIIAGGAMLVAGQFVLRLSERGADAALAYAQASCGLLTGIGSDAG